MKTRLVTCFAFATLGFAACATDPSPDATTGDDSDSSSDDPDDSPTDGKADDPQTSSGPVGPGAGAHVTFAETAQKGGFWELSDGQLYTAFTTSTEPMTYGRTKHNFAYALVAPDAEHADDAQIVGSAGSCVDDHNNGSCNGGLLEPSTQRGTTLTTSDGMLLVVGTTFLSGDHPQLRRIDPTGATPSEVIADLTSANSSAGNPPQAELMRLPAGELVVATSTHYGDTYRTFVLDATGATLAEIDGYAIGYRIDPLDLVILRHPANFTHEYAAWNLVTHETSPVGTIIVTNNNKSPNYDRPVITTDGTLVLWPREGAEKRIVRFERDGTPISDTVLPAGTSVNSITPRGDLVLEKNVTVNDGWDWSLVLADRDGTERTIYDRAALKTDAGWNITWNYTGNSPNLNDIKTLFDAAGNAYVSIVKSQGNSYQTYLAGFAANGDKQFGHTFDTVYSSPACLAHSVLPSGRLAVVCPGRVNNDLYLLDE